MGTAPSTSGMADDGDTGVTGGSGGAGGTAQYHRNGAACDDASDVAGATDGAAAAGGDAAGVMSPSFPVVIENPQDSGDVPTAVPGPYLLPISLPTCPPPP